MDFIKYWTISARVEGDKHYCVEFQLPLYQSKDLFENRIATGRVILDLKSMLQFRSVTRYCNHKVI